MTASTAGTNQVLHIGFDDTDSLKGRCTTQLAFKITDYLSRQKKADFLDYPLLIRLNPNVPWKTRGNGAVCLRVKANNHEKVMENIKQLVEEGSSIDSGANPGLAFYDREQIPEDIQEFSSIAMYDSLTKQKAESLAKKYG